MKIVYLTAGAGGMYCGTCLHDNTLAAALLKAGEDVLLVPTYTPLRTDEDDVSLHRVFFGGINVYLQQKSALFRHTPWFIDALLNWPGLLRWVTRRSVSINPADLGALTVSMLRGEDGRQRKELDKLLHWLAADVRPDVVHLSNAILVSMARPIRQRLGVPIVCGLSGEDAFLERIPQPHYSQMRDLLRDQAGDVDAFVAMNRYYAAFMAGYMGIDPARAHVVRHGLKLDGHGSRQRPPGEQAVTIGFLARICPDKGLHRLVEAFRMLCQDASLPPLKLKAAGYLAAEDQPYLAKLQSQLAEWGLADRFTYAGELDRAGKIAFLQTLDVMSVPTVYRESKGLSILEALANAVPVVLPAHGAFPELINDTGGGILAEPDNIGSLALRLKQLIQDPLLAADLGQRGQQAIRDRYHADAMARRMIELYDAVRGKSSATAPPSRVVAAVAAPRSHHA